MHKIIYTIISLVFVIYSTTPSTTFAENEESVANVASFNFTSKKPIEIIRELEDIYSTKIIASGSLTENPISLTLKNVTLEESMVKLLKSAHIDNYSIINNSKEKQLKLHILTYSKMSTKTTDYPKSTITNYQEEQKNTQSKPIPTTSIDEIPPAPPVTGNKLSNKGKESRSIGFSDKFDYDNIPAAPKVN